MQSITSNMIVRTSVLPILLLISFSEGARILGVFPMPSPSHYILGNALMRGLAEAGHDVTTVSPYFDKNPPKNGKWREIVLDDLDKEMKKKFDEANQFHMKIPTTFLWFYILNTGPGGNAYKTMEHPKLQELIHSGEKFDVVIICQFFNDGLKALAPHFGAHLVLFSNTGSTSLLDPLIGNPSLPSHFPELALGYQTRMTFFQRVLNTIFRFLTALDVHAIFYPSQNKMIQKNLPNPIDIHDVLYNTSLVLLNSHVSYAEAQPMVPCMVDIGGFHIKPSKELPRDLKKFLDEAKDGVIYFSMGSNLKSKNLPPEMRDAILRAFGKRKEKVLWKWEDDVLPGQPPNVKLGKWLPQQEILAHPNVKAFITHGGMLSTIETIYFGVPIIAIPVFGDQPMNANAAKQAGYAVVLPLEDVSEESLSSSLEEIISNPKYMNNAKERSRIMRDRQVKPLDSAIYWIEYVIRHNGAPHLRVPYLDLTWYQYYLLDVIAFLLLTFIATLYLIKKAWSYIRGRKANKRKVKTN